MFYVVSVTCFFFTGSYAIANGRPTYAARRTPNAGLQISGYISYNQYYSAVKYLRYNICVWSNPFKQTFINSLFPIYPSHSITRIVSYTCISVLKMCRPFVESNGYICQFYFIVMMFVFPLYQCPDCNVKFNEDHFKNKLVTNLHKSSFLIKFVSEVKL